MCHGRILNNKINKLHERAFQLVYKNETLNHLTNFFIWMNLLLYIHHRNAQKLAIEMYKVQKSLSPAFMQSIFPVLNNNYDFRLESALK